MLSKKKKGIIIFAEAFSKTVPGNENVQLQNIMLEFFGGSVEISNGICEFRPMLQYQESVTSVGSHELSNSG